jgi:hypothetical protein
MAAKIPDMKFDKEQTTWARWAQQEITSLKERLNAKDRSDSNLNQGMSATLVNLGNQVQTIAATETALAAAQATLATTVADLSARKTYAVNDGNLSRTISKTAGTGGYITTGISQTFTLTSTRNVLITISLFTSSAPIVTNATSGGSVSTLLAPKVDGVFTSLYSYNTIDVQPSFGSTAILTFISDAAVPFRESVVLNAGTHTIEPFFNVVVSGTVNSISVENASMTIQILDAV